jgi:NAD(P)-dependent dehydrogenase (short-subunit alcohol dehydrogenase family)
VRERATLSNAFVEKIAIVTGAASGIGAAAARRLSGLGARVVAVDLDEASAAAIADEIGGTAVAMDVSDPGSWDGLIASVTADFGGIDFAHLNAGIVTLPYPYEISDVTAEVYRRVMGVNLDGVALASTKLVQGGMGSGAGGAIVATASLGGLHPWPEDPYYAASKLGVVGFVRSAAPKFSELGVRIHAVCPSLVQTNILRGLIQNKIDDLGLPVLDPAEVAVAVTDLLAAEETGLVRTIVAGEGVRESLVANGDIS